VRPRSTVRIGVLALADNSPGAHHRERTVPAGDALKGSGIVGPRAYIQHATTLQHFEGGTLLTSRRGSNQHGGNDAPLTTVRRCLGRGVRR
jgi:hypothetical protein